LDDKGGLTAEEKEATIRELLEARSGVYHAAAYETEGMKEKRPQRGSFPHGTHWYYNNWDFNVLGAIFEKCTGLKIADSFHDRIAAPIGMQDFSKSDVVYVYEGTSIYPAYTFRMSARDMARFGLLYLRNGEWGDQQIVPKAWVKDSTTGYSSAGPGLDYGYLWWVARGWMLGNKIDRPGFRADGHGGQYIIVLPDDKLVISHVSNHDRTKRDSIKPFQEFLRLLLDAKSPGN
jgi:CubicO group peptidase (beta-lactamase class C family)